MGVPPEQPITINVLEFATAVFTIVVTAPLLANTVVDIGTDNTATLCWLVRNRSSPGAADALLKLLALTCVIFNIKLVAHHIRGIFNYLPDWISRVLGADFVDPQPFRIPFPCPISSTDFIPALYCACRDARITSRRLRCRLILSHILSSSVDMPTAHIILMMRLIATRDEVDVIADDRIPRVLTSFQRLISLGCPLPTLPKTLDDALAATASWDNIPSPSP